MESPEAPTQGLRVGVLTYDYLPSIGGLGVLAETYVRTLRKIEKNSVFTVISPATRSDEKGAWLGRTRWRKSAGCPLFSFMMTFSLNSIIAKYSLNVLHVHAGSGGVFLLRKPTCPVVVTSHHTYSQEAAVVFDRSPLKKIWKLFMSRLERRTYKIADLICCVSGDTKNEIIKVYKIDPSKVIVVENPVPIDVLKRFRGLETEKETIVFVGRLEERKGIMLLLETFQQLSKEFPQAKLRLVGRNLIGERLEHFLGAHQLADRVISLGYVHDPYRFREMSQATVLVVPSKLEGFGLVAAEGMMLGTCVVASDAPGLRSIIEDKKTGLIFKNNDKEDFLRVLRIALGDVNLRKSIEQNSMFHAEKRFSVEERAREMMNAFVSVTLGANRTK